MIRLHFTYRHVERPWGGANNFIRALHQFLSANGQFHFTSSLESPCDILFMNQLGTGPGGDGKLVPLRLVQRLVAKSGEGLDLPRRKLVVRAVNLNWHAFPIGLRNLTKGWWIDRQTIKLLNMADVAIFQSAYQRHFFRMAGYSGENSVIIHNGAAPEYWAESPPEIPYDGVLRLVTSTAAPRKTKRHDLIAEISLIDGVEVIHLGAWPKGQNAGKVMLMGTVTRESIVRVLSGAHYFLHPAVKDPCPNVLFEAVCAGLPVLYNPDVGSSKEILGDCGLALNENDLRASIETAVRELDLIRKLVIENRQKFTIGCAAEKYQAVFQRLALPSGKELV